MDANAITKVFFLSIEGSDSAALGTCDKCDPNNSNLDSNLKKNQLATCLFQQCS